MGAIIAHCCSYQHIILNLSNFCFFFGLVFVVLVIWHMWFMNHGIPVFCMGSFCAQKLSIFSCSWYYFDAYIHTSRLRNNSVCLGATQLRFAIYWWSRLIVDFIVQFCNVTMIIRNNRKIISHFRFQINDLERGLEINT